MPELSLHAKVVLVYLAALMLLGAWKARAVRTSTDFSLAGRGLGTLVLVGTLLATWIGTGSIFGNAEKTFSIGVPALLLPIAGGLGIAVLYLIAARLRRFEGVTIQDVLEARFGPAARVLGAVTLTLAYVIIVSYQYRAGSAVVGRIFELDPRWATAVVALFVIAYTALAGMYSVAYTDVANGVLMTVGVFAALVYLVPRLGGLDGTLELLEPAQRDLFGHFSAFGLLSVLLPTFLLLIGDANLAQRFFAARDAGSARRSVVGMFVGVLVLECAIIALALVGAALVARGDLDVGDDPGHLIVFVAFDALPDWLGAMLVATIVAIVVSTADSYLLSPATSLVRDVYQRFLRPGHTENEVLVSRAVVVALGVVALGLAYTSDKFFDVAIFAYTIYGAGITPALLAAYFWKRATPAGAVASMVSGVVVSIVWNFAVAPRFDEASWLADVDAVLPAVLVSVVLLVVVSLGTSPADPSAQRTI